MLTSLVMLLLVQAPGSNVDDLTILKQLFDSKCTLFADGEQHDASEFCTHFLELLGSESQCLNLIIQSNFKFSATIFSRCPHCGDCYGSRKDISDHLSSMKDKYKLQFHQVFPLQPKKRCRLHPNDRLRTKRWGDGEEFTRFLCSLPDVFTFLS